MCDRTQDFLRIVAGTSGSGVDLSRRGAVNAADVPKTSTAFNQAAAEIARGVHKTSAILAKLTNLVRRQGLFDDPTDEINNLIYRIKQDLDDLNSKCDSAQQYIDGKKSMFSRSGSGQSAEHSVKVVSHLKTDLMHATKDFKSVLEMRSSKMKDQQARKVELIGKGMLSPLKGLEAATASSSSTRNGKIGPAGNSAMQAAVQRDGIAGANLAASDKNGLVARKSGATKPLPSPYMMPYNASSASDGRFSSGVLEVSAQQQQQQLLLDPIAETQYYDAREKSVTEVEKTIGELGQLFKRLSTMIAEQQELVERVDEDIETATSNANKAHDFLMKTYEKVSSNRGMYMKISAILALFLLVFVLFLM